MAGSNEGDSDRDGDRCVCGAVVEPRTVDDSPVERGSCRECGLQLVRHRGQEWRQIRG